MDHNSISVEVRKQHTRTFIKWLRGKRIIPFVGAGVSANSGVPVWSTLIDTFARDLHYRKFGDTYTYDEYLDISEMYYEQFGRPIYMEKVLAVLDVKCEPNPLHKIILDIATSEIITTNFDDLIEVYASRVDAHKPVVLAGMKDQRNRCNGRRIYKMHGDFRRENFILRRKDYDGYFESGEFAWMVEPIITHLMGSEVIFIGYSVADVDFKRMYQTARRWFTADKEHRQGYLLEVAGGFDKEHYLRLREQGINVLYYEDIAEEIQRFAHRIPDEEGERLHHPLGRKLFDFIRYIFYESIDEIESIGLESTVQREPVTVDGDNSSVLAQIAADSASSSVSEGSALDQIYSALYPLRDVLALTPDIVAEAVVPYANRVGVRYDEIIITDEDLDQELSVIWNRWSERLLSEDEMARVMLIMGVLSRGGIVSVRLGSGTDAVTVRVPKPRRYSDSGDRQLVMRFKLIEAEAIAKQNASLVANEQNLPLLLQAAHTLMDVGEPLDAYELLRRISYEAEASGNYWLAFIAAYNRRVIARMLWGNIFYYPEVDDIFRLRDEATSIHISTLWEKRPIFQFQSLMLMVDSGMAFRKLHDELKNVLKEMKETLERTKEGFPGYYSPALIDRADYVASEVNRMIGGNGLLADYNASVRAIRADHCRAHFFQYATNRFDVKRTPVGDLLEYSSRVDHIEYAIIYTAITNFEPAELSGLLELLELDDITVSDDVLATLLSAFENLLGFASEVDWRQRLFFLGVYLPNFLILLSRINIGTKGMNVVCAAFSTYLKNRWMKKDWLAPLQRFFNRQTRRRSFPSRAELEALLFRLVEEGLAQGSELTDQDNLSRLIRSMAEALRRNDDSPLHGDSKVCLLVSDVLDGWKDKESAITDDMLLNVALPLHSILPPSSWNKLSEFVSERLKLKWRPRSSDVLFIVVSNGYIRLDEELTRRYFDDAVKAKHATEGPDADTYDDRRLKVFYNQIADLVGNNLVNRGWAVAQLEELQRDSPFLRFIIDPSSIDIDQLDVEWLIDVPEPVIATIASDETLRRAVVKRIVLTMAETPSVPSRLTTLLYKLVATDG